MTSTLIKRVGALLLGGYAAGSVAVRLSSFNAVKRPHDLECRGQLPTPELEPAARPAATFAQQDLQCDLIAAQVHSELSALDAVQAGLPAFSESEVAEHRSLDTGVWVTFRDGVYDVTDFITHHPGGSFILEAAGGPIDEFWNYWAAHYYARDAPKFLQGMLIGTLQRSHEQEEDGNAATPTTGQLPSHTPQHSASSSSDNAFYDNEPLRSSHTAILSRQPYESQTPRSVLARSYLTHNADFYVRNHAPTPDISPHKHTIRFHREDAAAGDHSRPTSVLFSLQALEENFEEVTVTSVLQCAGNRAQQMIVQNGPTNFSGSSSEFIDVGMMGNARWSGYRLADILRQSYPELRDTDANYISQLHVVFRGADQYSTSTPLRHILADDHDVLLATKMNGDPLPRDHGFPARVLLPGVAGARNVKWVTSVEITDTPCDSCWQQRFYKHPSGAAIQGLPMQSLILSVNDGDVLRTDADTTVTGIAWGGASGSPVAEVEVSTDRGQTWSRAQLLEDEVPADDSSRRWGWTRWEHTGRITGAEIWCRARTSAGEEQPENNFLSTGYLFNGYHRVRLAGISDAT